jgi:tetratricopeptide (TPR) repeat protein
MVLTVAFLCTLPWVLLGRSETASVTRFTDVAAGFPPKIQAYALEDLGNFFTSAKDFERAALVLERSVGADPDNARRYTLLGSAYRHLADDPGTLPGPRADHLRKAEDSYRESLRRDPDNVPALEDLGRLLMQRQDFQAAGDLYARAVRLEPDRAEAWEGLGYCLLDQQEFSGAAEAFGRTLDLSGADRVCGPLGVALTRLERYPEAHAVLQETLRRGNTALVTMIAYADCLVSWAEHKIATDGVTDAALLDEAENLTRRLLGQNPGAPALAALQDRLEALKAASNH